MDRGMDKLGWSNEGLNIDVIEHVTKTWSARSLNLEALPITDAPAHNVTFLTGTKKPKFGHLYEHIPGAERDT